MLDHRTVILMRLADAECETLCGRTIRYLQSLSGDHLQSGETSGLKNVWDEVCVQVQFQYSVFWDLYESIIRDFIASAVDPLPHYSKCAIWLQTEVGEDWGFEAEEQGGEPTFYLDDIVDYVYSNYVMREAANWSNRRVCAYLDRCDSVD
jgi:hypothetical protein